MSHLFKPDGQSITPERFYGQALAAIQTATHALGDSFPDTHFPHGDGRYEGTHCSASFQTAPRKPSPVPLPESTPSVEINQCDGCRAGIPIDGNGAHRMEQGEYADFMICQAEKYTVPSAAPVPQSPVVEAPSAPKAAPATMASSCRRCGMSWDSCWMLPARGQCCPRCDHMPLSEREKVKAETKPKLGKWEGCTLAHG